MSTTRITAPIDLVAYRRPEPPRDPPRSASRSFEGDETMVAFPDLIATHPAADPQRRRGPEHSCTPAYDARRRTALRLMGGEVVRRCVGDRAISL